MSSLITAVKTMLTVGDEMLKGKLEPNELVNFAYHQGREYFTSDLITANGNMLKYNQKTTIEPVILMTQNAFRSPQRDNIINLQIDLFAASLMTAVKLMINVDRLQASEALDIISSKDSDPAMKLVDIGLTTAVNWATESDTFNTEKPLPKLNITANAYKGVRYYKEGMIEEKLYDKKAFRDIVAMEKMKSVENIVSMFKSLRNDAIAKFTRSAKGNTPKPITTDYDSEESLQAELVLADVEESYNKSTMVMDRYDKNMSELTFDDLATMIGAGQPYGNGMEIVGDKLIEDARQFCTGNLNMTNDINNPFQTGIFHNGTSIYLQNNLSSNAHEVNSRIQALKGNNNITEQDLANVLDATNSNDFKAIMLTDYQNSVRKGIPSNIAANTSLLKIRNLNHYRYSNLNNNFNNLRNNPNYRIKNTANDMSSFFKTLSKTNLKRLEKDLAILKRKNKITAKQEELARKQAEMKAREDELRKRRYSNTDHDEVVSHRTTDALALLEKNQIFYGINIRQYDLEVNDRRALRQGEMHMYTYQIPMTVRAIIIVLPIEDILISLDQFRSDKTGFFARFYDWRVGLIDGWDLMFCTDLVENYKKYKFKNKDKLAEIINQRVNSSNSRAITSTAVGFVKNYNMYTITNEDKIKINDWLKADVEDDTPREKFLDAGHGLSLSIINEEYNHIKLGLSKMKSMTTINYKTLEQRNKSSSDKNIEQLISLLGSQMPKTLI